MPRTLVTGATGFIGTHLTRLLVERGDEVHALVRGDRQAPALAELSVHRHRGDILDRRSVRRAMRGVERVFHLAGATRLTGPREKIFALNVEGTRIVLEEALRAGVQRAVYTSSVAAIGPAPKYASADETNVWDAGRYGIPYVDAKHEAEVAALRLLGRGLPLVIVNPASVMGAGDPGRTSTVLVRRFLRRQIPAYVDGTINVVGVEDVARGHVLAEEKGRIGERYILGNRNFTLDRLFADLSRLSGVEPPAIKLPATLALALATAGGRIPGLTMPPVDEVRASSLNWAYKSTKAKRELGWTTSPHEDCLEATIAWYRERDGKLLDGGGTRQPLAMRTLGASFAASGSRAEARMATLYRCTTPTDWLCPCGRVARALRRDGVEFEQVVVPQRRSRRPEVEALTDQKRVPVLVIDGEAICDSRRIVEHLAFRREPQTADDR